MTFEEAIDIVTNHKKEDGLYRIPDGLGDAVYIIRQLEKNYAPNIEIPKWIADSFDKLISTSVTKYHGVADAWDYVVSENGFKEFGKWTDTGNAEQITIAYLNPLTRKFVEVVE